MAGDVEGKWKRVIEGGCMDHNTEWVTERAFRRTLAKRDGNHGVVAVILGCKGNSATGWKGVWRLAN